MSDVSRRRFGARVPRFLPLVVVAIGVLGVWAPTAQAQAPQFSDVSGTHAEAIGAIADEGITEGCTPTEYCPHESVTREQMASFLSRSLNLPPGPTGSFEDVGGSEHERAIGAIAEEGITEGCEPGLFCPGLPVSREQMASFLDRAFDVTPTDTTYFFDVAGTHAGSVQALGAAGISAGCDGLGVHYCPARAVKRNEMASFLARALGLVDRTWIPMLLEPGHQGEAVIELQQRLASFGYWIGPIDGVYGTLTEHAVLAIQKVHGLARDGIYGPSTRAAVAFPTTPATRSSAGYVVEFDESRQITMLVRDGHPETIFHSSGGDESYYTYDGTTYWAETPNGTWDIYRQIDGWRTSHLGELWRPKYFHTDGIAFHGYTNVPAHAASHGCVRLSMEAMDWIWAVDAMPIGTQVMVYGSPS